MSVDVGLVAALGFALLIVVAGWLGHIGKIPEPPYGYFLGPPMLSVVSGSALVSFGLATVVEEAGMPGTAAWLAFAGLVLGVCGFAIAVGWRPGWAEPFHRRGQAPEEPVDRADPVERGDVPPTG